MELNVLHTVRRIHGVKVKPPEEIKGGSKALRKILERTQIEFAAMVGASVHTIIALENERNQLSDNLSERIYAATGCRIWDGGILTGQRGQPYDRAMFDSWRKKSKRQYLEMFLEASDWLEVMFEAANRPGRGKLKDRLPAFHMTIMQALWNAAEEFKLNPDIENAIRERKKRGVGGPYIIGGPLD